MNIFRSPWHYRCDGGNCVKTELTKDTENPMSLDICQLFCGEGPLWPKPTGHMAIGGFVSQLNPDAIVVNGVNLRTESGQLLEASIDRLKNNAKSLAGSKEIRGGLGLTINVDTASYDPKVARLSLDTPEGYTLKIYQEKKNGEVLTYFLYFL